MLWNASSSPCLHEGHASQLLTDCSSQWLSATEILRQPVCSWETWDYSNSWLCLKDSLKAFPKSIYTEGKFSMLPFNLPSLLLSGSDTHHSLTVLPAFSRSLLCSHKHFLKSNTCTFNSIFMSASWGTWADTHDLLISNQDFALCYCLNSNPQCPVTSLPIQILPIWRSQY